MIVVLCFITLLRMNELGLDGILSYIFKTCISLKKIEEIKKQNIFLLFAFELYYCYYC